MKITEIVEEEYADIKGNNRETISLIESSKSFTELLSLYKFWLEDDKADWGFDVRSYNYAEKILTENRTEELYSIDEITKFCFAIQPFVKRENFKKSGAFLSALVNVHYKEINEKVKKNKEINQRVKRKNANFLSKEYILVTEHITPLDTLCSHNNGADITIQGNTGSNCCEFMQKGTVTLTGNAGNNLCFGSTGGKVIIRGNCGNWTGIEMENTTLEIFGNADNNLGYSMRKNSCIIVHKNTKDYTGKFCGGGIIKIYGDCGNYTGASMKKGVLIIKGKCGKNIGDKIEGGKIFLNEYESISETLKEKNYNKNVKIYSKNKRVYPPNVFKRIWEYVIKD